MGLPSSASALCRLPTLLRIVTSSSPVSDSHVLLNHGFQPSPNFFILIIPEGLGGQARDNEKDTSSFPETQLASLIIGLVRLLRYSGDFF